MSSYRSQAAFKRPLEYDEAIITSLIRYGEADCIVRLFCRDQGRVSAFVRNGLKPSAQRGSILQAPARARVGMQSRPHSDLRKLLQADIAAHTFLLSADLRVFGWASYVVEIAELFIPEQEPCTPVFDWLDRVLIKLTQKQASSAILRSFELKLLAHCGYLPDLDDTVDCPGQSVQAYDPVNGHLLTNRQSNTLDFDESARVAALCLLESEIDATPDYDERTLRMVAKIFASRLRHHAKGPLRSVEFLKSVGV